MKMMKLIARVTIAAALVAVTAVRADDSATNNPASKPTPYPLNTCPVSGDKLGEMGAPCVFVYQGQEIKFCCPDCKKDFLKDPQKYLKQIKDEAAKEAAAKPGK
jgi:YHS domain-containing protein